MPWRAHLRTTAAGRALPSAFSSCVNFQACEAGVEAEEAEAGGEAQGAALADETGQCGLGAAFLSSLAIVSRLFLSLL